MLRKLNYILAFVALVAAVLLGRCSVSKPPPCRECAPCIDPRIEQAVLDGPLMVTLADEYWRVE